ncbi:MAG TPA: hypothetical protein GX497_02125 [Bacillus bacterium]|nr:hypothetical protein [Bacillus sp. (in: firmicutes)]
MDELLRPLYEVKANDIETLGVLILDKTKTSSLLTEQFDAIMLIIKKCSETEELTYDVDHYNIEDKKIAVFIVQESTLLQWLSEVNHRKYLLWILNGGILFDRNEYIVKLRKGLLEFPTEKRKKKIAIEFAKLIRRYFNGKELYDGKQYLDAYNQMAKALHHLARLSVIEHGFYPELTVWNQVKRIEPEVYALYLELVESNELIEERVQLLLLAIEFAISSRSRIGSSYLIEIMKSKKDSWTISELVNEKELKELSADLGLLMQYLAAKHIVQIDSQEVDGQSIFQMKYEAR